MSGSTTKVVDYRYDAFNRLVRRAVDTTNPFNLSDAAIQRFVYDGDDVVLEFNSAGSLTRRFLNGPAVDQILAEEDVTVTPSTDAARVHWMLGDSRARFATSWTTAALANHIVYDSFGNTLSETHSNIPTSMATPASWPKDMDTGFLGSQTRWYDPVTGRWTSEDWDGLAAGDANLNRYVGNEVTDFVDPSGAVNAYPEGHLRVGRLPLQFQIDWTFALDTPYIFDVIAIQRVHVEGLLHVPGAKATPFKLTYYEVIGYAGKDETSIDLLTAGKPIGQHTGERSLDTWGYSGVPIANIPAACMSGEISVEGSVTVYKATDVLQKKLFGPGSDWKQRRSWCFVGDVYRTTWTSGGFLSRKYSDGLRNLLIGGGAQVVNEDNAHAKVRILWDRQRGNVVDEDETRPELTVDYSP